MSTEKRELLRALVDSDWSSVLATTTKNQPSVALDLIFSIPPGMIGLTGKAYSLSDDSEAFGLDIYTYPEEGRWSPGPQYADFLTSRDIKREFEENARVALLRAPRTARFFTDPRLRSRIDRGLDFFDDCCGIEFLTHSGGDTLRFVIVGSPNLPCEVEFATSVEACTSLLAGLKEIKLL